MKSPLLIACSFAILTSSIVAAPETSPRSALSMSHIAMKRTGADWYLIKVSKNSQMTITIRDHHINLLDVPQKFDYAITLDNSKNKFYKSVISFWQNTRTLIDAIGISDAGKVEFVSRPAFENLKSQLQEADDIAKPFLDKIGSQK